MGLVTMQIDFLTEVYYLVLILLMKLSLGLKMNPIRLVVDVGDKVEGWDDRIVGL